MEFQQKKSRVIPTNCVKQYNGAIVRTSYIGVRRERERTDRQRKRDRHRKKKWEKER